MEADKKEGMTKEMCEKEGNAAITAWIEKVDCCVVTPITTKKGY